VIRKAIPLLAFATLTGCSMNQIGQWSQWNRDDPAAAQTFAKRPEIQAQLTAPQVKRETSSHSSVWHRIAQCESGNNWHLRASNRTGTYGGGLMIADYVWRHYGGREFGATADRASQAQQIVIAERIRNDVGLQAWDCA
jgi:Transglycosylase-like domain